MQDGNDGALQERIDDMMGSVVLPRARRHLEITTLAMLDSGLSVDDAREVFEAACRRWLNNEKGLSQQED